MENLKMKEFEDGIKKYDIKYQAFLAFYPSLIISIIISK